MPCIPKKVVLRSMEEIQFEKDEFLLADLIVASIKDRYSLEKFKADFNEFIEDRGEFLTLPKYFVDSLRNNGILWLLVISPEGPFPQKMIKGVKLFSRARLPPVGQSNFIRYIDNLPHLKQILQNLNNSSEFEKLQNCLFSAFFKGEIIHVNSIQALNKENRRLLGKWEQELVRKTSGLGKFEVKKKRKSLRLFINLLNDFETFFFLMH